MASKSRAPASISISGRKSMVGAKLTVINNKINKIMQLNARVCPTSSGMRVQRSASWYAGQIIWLLASIRQLEFVTVLLEPPGITLHSCVRGTAPTFPMPLGTTWPTHQGVSVFLTIRGGTRHHPVLSIALILPGRLGGSVTWSAGAICNMSGMLVCWSALSTVRSSILPCPIP